MNTVKRPNVYYFPISQAVHWFQTMDPDIAEEFATLESSRNKDGYIAIVDRYGIITRRKKKLLAAYRAEQAAGAGAKSKKRRAHSGSRRAPAA